MPKHLPFHQYPSQQMDQFPGTGLGQRLEFVARQLGSIIFQRTGLLAQFPSLVRFTHRGNEIFGNKQLNLYEELGIGRLEPQLSQAELEKYYARAYWEGRMERGEEIEPGATARGRSQVEYVTSQIPGTQMQDTLSIEYGPGLGGFSFALSEQFPGLRPFAVEMSDITRETLQRSGQFEKVFKSLYEANMHMFKERPSLFAASHALEHVTNLNLALDQIDEVLSIGSYIFFEVPNCGEEYYQHSGIHIPHTYYISSKGMKTIASARNWKIVDVSEWGPTRAEWLKGAPAEYYPNKNGLHLRALFLKAG